MEPPVVSHGYGGGFASNFIWSGAADYSALLAVPAVIQDWWGEDGMARPASLVARAALRQQGTGRALHGGRRAGAVVPMVFVLCVDKFSSPIFAMAHLVRVGCDCR